MRSAILYKLTKLYYLCSRLTKTEHKTPDTKHATNPLTRVPHPSVDASFAA